MKGIGRDVTLLIRPLCIVFISCGSFHSKKVPSFVISTPLKPQIIVFLCTVVSSNQSATRTLKGEFQHFGQLKVNMKISKSFPFKNRTAWNDHVRKYIEILNHAHFEPLHCPTGPQLQERSCKRATDKLPWWLSSSFKLLWRWTLSLKHKIWAWVKSQRLSEPPQQPPDDSRCFSDGRNHLVTEIINLHHQISHGNHVQTHPDPLWGPSHPPVWAFQWTFWCPEIWPSHEGPSAFRRRWCRKSAKMEGYRPM